MKKSPEDLPSSRPILYTLIFLQWILFIFQFSVQTDLLTGLWQGSFLLFIFLGFTAFVLFLKGYLSRFVQAMTALMGLNLVLSLFAYLSVIGIGLLYQGIILFLAWQPLITFLLLLRLIFLLLINLIWIVGTSHIYSKAISWPFLGGLFLSITLLALDFVVLNQLFGLK